MRSVKFEALIETARHLFMRYGIRRVSIEEICSTANVSKMTFYKHFSNKKELLKALIEALFSESMRRYAEIMSASMPYSRKAELLIELKVKGSENVSREFLKEYVQNSDPEIVEFINQKMQAGLEVLRRDFIKAQEDGHIRSDIKPEFVVYLLNHIMEMLSDECLIRLYPSPQEITAELMKFYFYGILNRNDPEHD